MAVRLIDGHTVLRAQWESSIRRREEAEALAAGEASRQRLPFFLRPLLGWAISSIARDDYLTARHNSKRKGDAAENAVLSALLAALEDDPAEWLVLQGVVLQRRSDLQPLEVDILTLGPVGIAVTEVKAWSNVYLTDSAAYVLRQGYWEKRKSPLVQLRGAAGLLIGLIAEAGLPYIPIHTSVCFPWMEGTPFLELSPRESSRCPIYWGAAAGSELAQAILSLPRRHIDLEAVLQALRRGGLQLAA